MIVPDVNLLVYAYNAKAPRHLDAKAWWESLVNGRRNIGLPWMVVSGFVRIMTHPKVLTTPMLPSPALDVVELWFQYAHISPVHPGGRHLPIFRQMLDAAGVGGNLVTDAHIAAIGIELQAEVHSNDSDFGRFPGLNWANPLP